MVSVTGRRALRTFAASVACTLVTLAVSAQSTSPTLDLLNAARRGDVGSLERALAAGASVNAADPSFRQTALIRAAMFGHADVARVLMKAGADVHHVGSPDDMRAIHWASREGHADVVRALLDGGADVNSPDVNGATPLEYAVAAGSVTLVDTLLAADADPEKMHTPISARIGMALNGEVAGAEVDAMAAVIRRGRGLERASGLTGEGTALLALASRANRPGADRLAEALVTAGANLAATDEKGRTARQIVEAWIPTQRNAGYRKTLEAVATILQQAEARR